MIHPVEKRCGNCRTELKFLKRENVQLGKTSFLFGDWPNLLSGLTIGFNNAVLSEASMSYLGIGVGPADASLGRMLSESQGYLLTAPWCTIFPAIVVILLILGVGMVGEGIRDRVGESR